MELNQRQMEALHHKDGPMMVLAGPGSGKTTVITHRIKFLIDECNVSPDKILVITFTKIAAEEMKSRFKRMVEEDISSQVSFGTFHSFFFRIIRSKRGYSVDNILKDYERKEVLKRIIGEAGLDDDEEFFQSLCNEMSRIKNELLTLKYYNAMCCGNEEFELIVNRYEQYKETYHKIDFDDMLTKCYEIISTDDHELSLWQNRYEYILIDEFQDINKVQYECIKLLSLPKNNLFIVGDDDQSIYKFRGARPEFLLQFTNDVKNVKKTILNTNYRSTDNIIAVCNRVISDNQQRYEKDINGTDRKGKDPILLRSEGINEEALFIGKKIKSLESKIDLNEIAVIYRTNIQSRAFVDTFMDLNIPFQLKDEIQTIYDHFIAADIRAYFSLALDKTDNLALERIINKPKRYITKNVIRLSKKQDGSLINNILKNRQLQPWQETRIEELIMYLNSIGKRKPYDAFRYIRQAVRYDEYLIEHADFRKISAKG